VRKLIAGLLGLVLLAVLADIGAAAFTEYRLSRAIRAYAHLGADPEVAIRGLSFLAQAQRGTYDHIDVRADGVSTDYAGNVTLEATMRGVALEPSSLVSTETDSIAAEELDGRLIIHQTGLGRQFNLPDLEILPLPLRVFDAFGTADRVEMERYRRILLTATLADLGLEDPVSVEARAELAGSTLSITPITFYRGRDGKTPVTVPEELREQALRSFAMTLTVGDVPFGLQPATLMSQGGRLIIESTGKDVHLTMDGHAGAGDSGP
jgi:hypothetical protein